MSEIIGDAPCPKCVEAGKDKTGNHLILFKDGGAYCNRCEYSEGEKVFTQPNPNFGQELSDEDAKVAVAAAVAQTTVQSIPVRGIDQVACEHFGVRVSLSETDGQTQTATYFPVSVEGKHTGFKVRYPSKNFGKVGNRKGGDFFGANVCPKKGNKIFVTEGEYDALALYQTIYELCDPKWRRSIAVVSLLNGAGGAAKEMLRNNELLAGFKEIVCVFDQDEAGQEGIEEVVKVLGRDRVKSVKLSEKDANDMVQQGLKRELYFACITEKAIPRPEKIISGKQITLEDLQVPLIKGLDVPYPELMKKMRGFRHGDGGGELTIWCAGSGMGKTTAAREVMYHLNKVHKKRLGHIFLEEQFRKTSQSYIAIDNNVPLAALREDPTIVNQTKFKKSHAELIANDRTFFLKHFGSLASDHLIDYLMYMGVHEECNFIILDHISMVVSGQDNGKNGERKDIDILMTKLAAFCEDTGVSVQAIVHLKRPQNGCFNDGQSISLAHLRGSAAIEQLSHNIIGIEGDQHGDNPNSRILRVLKNREWGDVGEADTLEYMPATGRLLPQQVHIGGAY